MFLSRLEAVTIEARIPKKHVQDFLNKLSEVLSDPEFNISQNFLFITRGTNLQTLADLDYDTEHVVENLRTLTVEEFCEAKIDKDNAQPPFLMVFGRTIDQKLVYIKIKIREKEDCSIVVCVSFHFADYPMNFPYK